MAVATCARREQVDQDKQPVMTQVETLLALLFPALRVELGLLRRIRRLLPANPLRCQS